METISVSSSYALQWCIRHEQAWLIGSIGHSTLATCNDYECSAYFLAICIVNRGENAALNNTLPRFLKTVSGQFCTCSWRNDGGESDLTRLAYRRV